MRYLVAVLPWLLAGCVVHEVVEERVPARQPVNIEDVVAACRQGSDQQWLVADVQVKGVSRAPSTDDVIALKQAGASDVLVRALIEAPVVEPRPAEVRRTVYYDTRPAFTLGALATWAFFGHHHHRTPRRCGR